jgi:hypothetical protein
MTDRPIPGGADLLHRLGRYGNALDAAIARHDADAIAEVSDLDPLGRRSLVGRRAWVPIVGIAACVAIAALGVIAWQVSRHDSRLRPSVPPATSSPPTPVPTTGVVRPDPSAASVPDATGPTASTARTSSGGVPPTTLDVTGLPLPTPANATIGAPPTGFGTGIGSARVLRRLGGQLEIAVGRTLPLEVGTAADRIPPLGGGTVIDLGPNGLPVGEEAVTCCAAGTAHVMQVDENQVLATATRIDALGGRFAELDPSIDTVRVLTEGSLGDQRLESRLTIAHALDVVFLDATHLAVLTGPPSGPSVEVMAAPPDDTPSDWSAVAHVRLPDALGTACAVAPGRAGHVAVLLGAVDQLQRCVGDTVVDVELATGAPVRSARLPVALVSLAGTDDARLAGVTTDGRAIESTDATATAWVVLVDHAEAILFERTAGFLDRGSAYATIRAAEPGEQFGGPVAVRTVTNGVSALAGGTSLPLVPCVGDACPVRPIEPAVRIPDGGDPSDSIDDGAGGMVSATIHVANGSLELHDTRSGPSSTTITVPDGADVSFASPDQLLVLANGIVVVERRGGTWSVSGTVNVVGASGVCAIRATTPGRAVGLVGDGGASVGCLGLALMPIDLATGIASTARQLPESITSLVAGPAGRLGAITARGEAIVSTDNVYDTWLVVVDHDATGIRFRR